MSECQGRSLGDQVILRQAANTNWIWPRLLPAIDLEAHGLSVPSEGFFQFLRIIDYWILDRESRRQISWTPTDQELWSQLRYLNYGGSAFIATRASSGVPAPRLYSLDHRYETCSRDKHAEPLVVIDKSLMRDIKAGFKVYVGFELSYRESSYKRHSFVRR